jgi:hypothetical protein
MKKLHVLAVVIGIAVVMWHLYTWVFVYDADVREGRIGVILSAELGVRGMSEGIRDQAERVLLGRLERLVAERTLFVVALGLGLMQGLSTRATLVYSGYRQNLWLSARLALLVALGTVAATCTLPGLVPYTPVVLGLLACVYWAGFSGVAAFPVSM